MTWKKFNPFEGTVEIDSIEDLFKQKQNSQPNKNKSEDNWKEIDLTSKFSGMLPKSKEDLIAYHYNQQQSQNSNNNNNQVFIKEGFQVFKPVSNMETNVDIAVFAGMSEELRNKEFIVHSKKKFLIVESHNKPIDLSNLTNQKFLILFVVEAPFIGKLLVPEQAIRKLQSNNSQIILKG